MKFIKSLGLGAVALIVAAPAAQAHAYLTHAVPGAGAVVSVAPREILLSYTEGLEVAFCRVTVQGPDGASVASAKPQPVPGHEDEMAVAVKITAPGTYRVVWHAVSVDTHHTHGAFRFTFQP
ncbi:copper resistance CopC family protein [Acidocella sp.]|uniref:copper resistance CopC family protein n=1 Tax=Acidocella sp. TaxID=50710 RepID=UPI00260793A6|nr:copper resistance CopC family protein [Acidocella sp.]